MRDCSSHHRPRGQKAGTSLSQRSFSTLKVCSPGSCQRNRPIDPSSSSEPPRSTCRSASFTESVVRLEGQQQSAVYIDKNGDVHDILSLSFTKRYITQMHQKCNDLRGTFAPQIVAYGLTCYSKKPDCSIISCEGRKVASTTDLPVRWRYCWTTR